MDDTFFVSVAESGTDLLDKTKSLLQWYLLLTYKRLEVAAA